VPKNWNAGTKKNDMALRFVAKSVRVLNRIGRLAARSTKNGRDHVDQPTVAPGKEATKSKGMPTAKASKLPFILRTW
jgi:hypothetical protein